MNCSGCGSTSAVVTRTWWDRGSRYEVCNDPGCGNLSIPWNPDAYLPRPTFFEHLGDETNPYGRMVETKRQKARIMREQGIREDGDRFHGSEHKGVKKRPFRLKKDFEKKLDYAIRKSIPLLKRRP